MSSAYLKIFIFLPTTLIAACASSSSADDLVSIHGLGRSPGERNGYPLQYSGLENSMDCIVHGVAKSQTRLSDFHLTVVEEVGQK